MLESWLAALGRLGKTTRGAAANFMTGLGGTRKDRLPRTAAMRQMANSANTVNRRQMFASWRSVSVLGTLGVFSKGHSQETVVRAGPTPARVNLDEQTLAPAAELQNYARLKALDLNSRLVVARQQNMPVGKIGNLTVGRLISGSNLINMNMHARDLPYVTDLAKRYSTEGRMFMTLKKLEEHGVNTFVLKANNFRQYDLRKYKREWGGKLQWIADVIVGRDIDRFEKALVEHLELGAEAAYLWGGSTDQWFAANQQANIVRAYEIMKRYKIPAGICTHRLEPIKFCEKEGLKPDFYFTTFHHDRYWSAHPKQNRGFLEVFEKKHAEHDRWHDNMFCHDPDETTAFMQDVKVPWITFKVLAAGAIPPEDGFRFAFQNGADFICVGMFDWQVEQDVDIAIKSIAEAKARKRPWFGQTS
jgi:hypothetical protein